MLSYSSNLPLLSCSSSSSSSSSTTRFVYPPHYPTTPFSTVSHHHSLQTRNTIVCNCNSTLKSRTQICLTSLLTVGAAMAAVGVGPTIAAESAPLLLPSIELHEPSNALSLPTWAIHVSSVAEWIIAMALVWQYGEKPGNESWKGLSWGMVPLLGGAMCACTWHFFYNAESLEVLVALQAALTVIGNATLCLAAFRIYKSQSRSENI